MTKKKTSKPAAEPQALDVFNPLKVQIAEFVAPALQMTVVDGKSSDAALAVAKDVKAMLKRVDDTRRSLVDPLNAQVRKINDYAKDIEAPLKDVDAHLRRQLNAWAAERERIRQEEVRKAEEERRRREAELAEKQRAEREALEAGAKLFGEEDPAVEQELEQQHAKERMKSLVEHKAALYDANETQLKNVRKVYDVEVLDLEAVPKEFLIREVNKKAAIEAMKAGVKIPGLKLTESVAVAIGRNTRVPRALMEG